MRPTPEDLIQVLPGIATGDELAQLAAALEVRTFLDGEIVCRQGDAGSSAFLVAQGNIDVRVGRARSRVAVLRRGQMFGQMSLVDGHLRSATCRAVGETVLYELTSPALQNLARYSATIAARILWRIARQLAGNFRSADALLGRLAEVNPWLDLSTVAPRDLPESRWTRRPDAARPVSPAAPPPPEPHSSFRVQFESLARNLADVDLDRVRVVGSGMPRAARIRES